MKTKDKFHRSVELITGKRWCSQCNWAHPIQGGEWVSIMKGLRRRWKCADCVQRNKTREKARF